MTENFRPTVMIDGESVEFEGWMLVLAFALRGIPWAVEQASSDEFDLRGKMRDYEHRKNQYHIKEAIIFNENEAERIQARLKELKDDLDD